MMRLDEIEKTAGDVAVNYFGNGFHCAEAVVAAVLEVLGEEKGQALAYATPFGGGIGRTFNELCGALSGGLIVIGHLYGRKEPGGDWDRPAALGELLRQHFLQDFQTTNCKTLRDKFGDEAQMDECRNIVREVTIKLLCLLADPATPSLERISAGLVESDE